jgi:uncharacterized membrane protein
MKALKVAIDCLFIFILLLIITGGFRVHSADGIYEISRLNLFVVLIWALIAIYFLVSKLSRRLYPLNDLLPIRATNFLFQKFGEMNPNALRNLGLILSGVFAVTLIICSICKYYSFNAYMWDLGFFDNLLWNTSIGNFYRVAAVFKPYQNVLGDHIHPIILVFLPFYKIYPTPVWFLLFQPIIVAIAAWGVFRLARTILKDQALAFLFLVAFITYLPLRMGVLFDFHESCFSPAVYIWMFVYYFERKYNKALILFVLSFAIKETAGLYNSVLLLSILFSNQDKRHKIKSVLLAVISFALFLFEIEVLIPHFRSGTEYEYSQFYQSVGRTPSGIVQFLFAHPIAFLNQILQHDKIIFILKVLAPLAFLSLFSLPGIFIVLVPIAVLIFSDDPKMYNTQFIFHYGLNLAPFVFLSAILGLKNLHSRLPHIQKVFLFFLILWLSLALYDKSEFMRIRSFWPVKEDFQLHSFLRNIPKEKTVRSISTLVPHFSERNHFQEASWERALPENEDYYIIPTFYLTTRPDIVNEIKGKHYRLLREIRKVSIFVRD